MGKALADAAFLVIWLIWGIVAIFIAHVIYTSTPTQQEVLNRFEKISQERIAKCNAKNGTPVLNENMMFQSCILTKGTP